MSLYVYTIEQATEWDSIVRSFNQYDTYWLSGYVKAFQIHGDGIPLLFYYFDSNVRGISVAMKRDIAVEKRFMGRIPEGQYFDLATPYGYGGWLIEGGTPSTLFNEYQNWCKNNGIVSEFVRFHPVLENHKICSGTYDVIELGKVVTLDTTSPEKIWSNLTSKNRNSIRKAQKSGVKVYNARDPEIFKTFKLIYDSTMDKDKADEYYYFGDEFYSSVLEDLPFNSQVFYAEYEDKVIAASIMLFANGKINYHLSGSIKNYSSRVVK